jgi:hypothetical protein
MTRPPVHYLRAAKTAWSPPALYVLDTETRTVAEGDRQIEALRLWVAQIVDRRGPVANNREAQWTKGTTAVGLARSVENATALRPTLWLFAHNLGFDLVTTRLPLVLIERDWEVGDFALNSDTPFMRLHNGKRSLTMVDSVAFLYASIKDLGTMVGRKKPPLPRQNSSEAVWLRRCRADVAILTDALVAVLDWHDKTGGGYWSITGTSTAFGHMRQRVRPKAVLIDPDPDAQARDRAALYGGRRQVNRVGVFRGRRYLEIDMVAAYPTIATVLPVPVRRVERFATVPLDHPIWGRDDLGLLAAVRVRTDTPRYPLRLGGATWHPVGEFWTTLAGPEIVAARRRGDLRRVGVGELHQLAPALAEWAQWLLGQRDAPDEAVPAVVKHALKVWGRTVIGRFAGHTWTRNDLGPSPVTGWGYEPGVNATTGLPGGFVHLGGTRYWTEQAEGAANAYPAITAWIESATRDALGTVIDAIGPGAVVYANTDGLVAAETMLRHPATEAPQIAVDGLRGAARTQVVLDAVSGLIAPLRLAVKHQTTNLAVQGPTHIRFGAQRKLAGIPADADEDTPGRFAFRAWPSMTWQMSDGDGRGYHRPMMLRQVDGPYPAGWVLDDGTVAPPVAVPDDRQGARLLSWARTSYLYPGRTLAGPQHPYLDGLL